ncbi:MAG: hypothetical protein UMU75_07405 [Halomonas sp.]|nr:hypothetical protein [Halomonas sp.]
MKPLTCSIGTRSSASAIFLVWAVGLAFPGEMQVGDTGLDRLAGLHGGVLADQDCAAEGRLVGIVAAVLHATGADRAAVIGRFQLVPVELLLLGPAFLLAVGFDQYHRQIGDLGEVARACRHGRLGRVEAFIVLPAAQLPKKLDQRGLTGTGLTNDLEEGVALLALADLLGKQRAQPPRQRHDATLAESAK